MHRVRRVGPLLWYLPPLLVCAAVSVASFDIEGTGITVSRVPSYRWLIEWQPQSTALFALAAVLAAASAAPRRRVRAAAVLVCLAALAGVAIALPLDDRLHMGDAETYTASRGQFDAYFSPTTVRFEAHLSAVLLRWLDRYHGRTELSPAAALASLSRGATAWFVAMLLVAAAAGSWSALALRYLALALAAPAALMYFGYRELGYLSLTPASVPLVMAGLQRLQGRLESGAVLSGLGAALHGFGVLSMAGMVTAVMAAREPLRVRLVQGTRAIALAGSAYLGWVFVYIVVFGLTVAPGHASQVPWRPLLVSTVSGTRMNWAVLSLPGMADVLAAAWMAGLPLLPAACMALRAAALRGPALAYALPSVLFLCAFWPVQGLGAEADLVVAAFPGVYALAWLAAHSPRSTVVGLILLASSHIVFWRVLLSDAFISSRS